MEHDRPALHLGPPPALLSFRRFAPSLFAPDVRARGRRRIFLKRAIRANHRMDKVPMTAEGLMAAQDCLPDNETRDRFAAELSYLMRLWEAISPDPLLGTYEVDYRWLVQVYESVKPVSVTGQLLWETVLPAAGNATPATYEVDGRQYFVIAAGGGKSGAPSGGSYIAFSLP